MLKLRRSHVRSSSVRMDAAIARELLSVMRAEASQAGADLIFGSTPRYATQQHSHVCGGYGGFQEQRGGH